MERSLDFQLSFKRQGLGDRRHLQKIVIKDVDRLNFTRIQLVSHAKELLKLAKENPNKGGSIKPKIQVT